MSPHMCPGASACPDCDPEGYVASLGGGDGLAPGQASKIAEAILADPRGGSEEAPRFYRTAEEARKAATGRRNRHLDGYGRRENVR